jgi:hypothetical protein
MLTQAELKPVAEAERKIKELEEMVAMAKKDFQTRLEDGEPCEYGEYNASVVDTGQVRPAWKNEYLKEFGEEAVEAIIKKTKKGESKAVKITVRSEDKSAMMNAC